MKEFKEALLESVRQMKRGEAARITTVKLSKKPVEYSVEVVDMKTE